jgi:hypothetical protein
VLNYLNRFGYFPAQVEGERGGSLVVAANGVSAALKNLQKMAGIKMGLNETEFLTENLAEIYANLIL